MSAFFSSQLDFILFFYGLAFILLGATCVAIARMRTKEESWSVLALFAFLHGGGEWLDLTAMVIRDSPAFAVARTVLMTASFVLLMEFARREAIRLGFKAPGPWLYLPLLTLIAIGGAVDGVNSAGAFARYILGFFGAMATSLVFVRLSVDFSGFMRRLALCTAAGFAAYGVAAGIVVPAGSIWPTTVINYVWFDRVFGIPIQFVRGVLACWLAFSLWAIWGQQLVSDVASTRYTQFLRRQFIWTLAAMAAILIVGWSLTEALGDIYKQNVQTAARGDINLLASRIASETTTVDGMVKRLAGSHSVRALLVGGDGGQEDERAKTILNLDAEAAVAKAGYILNRSGAAIAAFGPGQGSAADLPDDSSAPYFQQSVAGAPGYYFAFDAETGERDYYASYPIRADDGAVVGVAVLKKSLGDLEADLRLYSHPYFLIDPNGVVVVTNRPHMMFQTLWPLPAAKRAALASRFGALNDRSMLPHEVADSAWTSFDGGRAYLLRRNADHGQWSLVILSPMQEIYASRVLGIVITLLVAIMTLIYLFGRERWVHDNVQTERRLRLQELARDLRSQAITDPLTGLFNRLRFDEALAGEIVRSARYKTPLSLVLYDVDQFKAVNDTHGHQAGDIVLTRLSALVANNIRGVDVLARWGGEEFVIMLPGCDAAMACQAAEKLRAAVGQAEFDAVGHVTCSFGVAQYVDGDTAASLVARADDALYRAKANGRNRVELAPSPTFAVSGLASVA